MTQSIDKIWEKIHSSQAWGGYPSEHVIRFVARNYYNRDRKNIRILDFGCGQGAHTWYLAREGFDTYAFDGSESAVMKCREKLEAEGLKANFFLSDATNLKFDEDFFDAVIDNVCVYANRMMDIKTMYHEILHVLKPGGKLLTVSFGEELEGYQSGKEVEPGTWTNIKEGVLANRGISHIWNEKELTNILYETGFSDVDLEWMKYTDQNMLVHQYICKASKGV